MNHTFGLVMVAAYFATMIVATYLYNRLHKGN